MGRVREHIEVKGQKFWTLFDTGPRNTYVVPRVAALLATSEMPKPFRPALGGQVREVTRAAVLDAAIEGREISTHAMVLDEIGKDEDGKPIDVLFGALAMQQWGIRPRARSGEAGSIALFQRVPGVLKAWCGRLGDEKSPRG